MARCLVTVEGRTLTVEARSLHMACIEYNSAQLSGFARDYPRLTPLTAITVRVGDNGPVHAVTWQRVLDWANRVAAANTALATSREASRPARPPAPRRA